MVGRYNSSYYGETGRQQTPNQEIFVAGEVSWNLSTSINVSCATHKRKAPQGKIVVFFLQDTLTTAF